MNNGKSASSPSIRDHDAIAIPPVKRKIIIHDTSESEDDTTDLPPQGTICSTMTNTHQHIYQNSVVIFSITQVICRKPAKQESAYRYD
jgi:hypothetical protein